MIKAYLGFLNTYPIWENKQFGIQQFEFPSLDMQSFRPKPIPQNIRLGHQMEFVFKQLLEYSEAYEVILYNLPIRKDKITLGEIDFILKDIKKNKLIHVELTYKFYLINSQIPEPQHQLTGPNKHDAFFNKMEKIKNKQFPLLHSEEGIKTLINNNLYESNIEHQCCFKAQLFQPYEVTSIQIEPINKNCIVGYWLRINDFNSSEFSKYQFYIPSKSQWVIEPRAECLWKSHLEISKDINQQLAKENSPLLWMRKSETKFEKFFVVWW